MSLTFKIEGGKELQRALSKIPLKFEKRIAKSAVRAGAAVILKEARLRVPVDDGVLKKSLRVVARRSRRHSYSLASVVTRQGKKWQAQRMDAWYAHIIEFGSKFHSARPFMRPALDTRAAEAIKAVGQMIAKKIGDLV